MITPLDVKQQTFKRVLRGYDVEEVKAFLNNLSREWEGVLDEKRKLQSELERVKDKLRTYKDMEAALHRTLQQAEQTAASTSEAAKREAEMLLRETRQKAQDILESARRKQEETERETRELIFRRDGVAAELKTFLLAQLERLKMYEARISGKETPALETREVRPAPEFNSPPVVGEIRSVSVVPTDVAAASAAKVEAVNPEPLPYSPPATIPVAPSPQPAPEVVRAPSPQPPSSKTADTLAPVAASFFESALSPPPTPDFLDEL